MVHLQGKNVESFNWNELNTDQELVGEDTQAPEVHLGGE